MKYDEFKIWLENVYLTKSGEPLKKGPKESTLSRCQRIEAAEGNLDGHYDLDQMSSLLERLIYSKEDYRTNIEPKHRIRIDGNIYKGTSSLRSAAGLYKKFRTSAF